MAMRLQIREETLTEAQQQVFNAVIDGRADDIQRLLRKHGTIDLDVLDSSGLTSLGRAAQLGYLEVVKLLLQGGADVNQADFYGQTALQYTASTNDVNIAKVLISSGANLDWNDVNNDGLSALHIAACQGKTGVAALIIEAGANVSAKDMNDVSVLHCAVANGHVDMVRRLLAAKADTNVTGSRTHRTPLFLAMDVEDEEMVDILLNHGAKVNIQDDFGLTVLCGACMRNCGAIALKLISAHARVNLADSGGNLPLHYAARNGHLAVVKALLEAGSEVNQLNCHQQAPLHMAVSMTHVDIVGLLIDNGADPNLHGDEVNKSAVHVAVETTADPSIFETLLQILVVGGATLDILHNDRTALWRATDDKKEEVAVLLVQYGADPNIEGPHGITVLHKACRLGLDVLVCTLLHAGLNWNQEQWLSADAYSTGISPHLVTGYAHGIPMALHDKLGLFCTINTVRGSTQSLLHLARLALRAAARSAIYTLTNTPQMPPKLKEFVLLKIL